VGRICATLSALRRSVLDGRDQLEEGDHRSEARRASWGARCRAHGDRCGEDGWRDTGGFQVDSHARPGVAEAWDDAYKQGADVLEDEAWRRAVEGVEKPIVSGGRS
jgi:hypothetical protein